MYANFEFFPESIDGVYIAQVFNPLPTITPDESLSVGADWVWAPIYEKGEALSSVTTLG